MPMVTDLSTSAPHPERGPWSHSDGCQLTRRLPNNNLIVISANCCSGKPFISVEWRRNDDEFQPLKVRDRYKHPIGMGRMLSVRRDHSPSCTRRSIAVFIIQSLSPDRSDHQKAYVHFAPVFPAMTEGTAE
jgi:hypothetical protein